MELNELNDLITDCKFKAQNLITATDTVKRGEFKDLWQLENYLSCIEDSKTSVKNLIEHLNSKK